jgi:hypothetical protein
LLGLRETPEEELKLDGFGVTLEKLREQDLYRWMGLVDWLSRNEESPVELTREYLGRNDWQQQRSVNV